jgi:TRAP transporter TAXI family solute receptor
MKRSFLVSVLLIGLMITGFICSDIAMARDKQSILIGGGRTSSPWYPFTQALAKFINDKSDWLQAETVSTAGITGNVDMVKEKPQQYIGISSFSHIHYRPGHEWGKKRGYYTGDRFISLATSMPNAIVTYDPKIKTVEDLAGKTVDVGRKGAANTPDHKAILEKYGVLDKVKLVYTGYGGGANKMKDGLVDATFMIFDLIYPDNFRKGGIVEKMETRGPIYYVGFDRNILMDLRAKEYAVTPVKIPAGALDPKTQPNMLWGYDDPTFFIADKSMDPDVVYEVTRIIWETPAEEWAKWHPMGAHMNNRFKAAVPSTALYQAHPGAKKFYDEQGVKIRDLADLVK